MVECLTEGVILAAKKCWWIKINTKPVRTHALDGAVFPYLVTVRYSANGTELTGKKLVVWKDRVPRVGSAVTVKYNADKPAKIRRISPKSAAKK
ncbi:MAG: sugar ABC transporter permease [Oscillospiraceae bacterium]|nr:sugar ABC transporter permease [Oscillospiraceae bacterium]